MPYENDGLIELWNVTDYLHNNRHKNPLSKYMKTKTSIHFTIRTIGRVICCVLFLLSSIFLSSCGADRNIKKGDKFMSLGEYYDAAEQYKQAYRRTPPKDRDLRGKISRKIALANDHINASAKAIAAYRNVIRYHKDDIDTHVKLADNLMKQGQYREAAKEYRLALDSASGNKEAMMGLEAATEAPELKRTGSRYKVKKMEIFNSRRSDCSSATSTTSSISHLHAMRHKAMSSAASQDRNPAIYSSLRKTTKAIGRVHRRLSPV